MWRNRRELGFGACTLVLGLLLLATPACSSGDADDAEAIVQTTTTTDPEAPATTVPGAGTGTSVEGAEDISVSELEVGTCFDDPAFAAEGTATVSETTEVQCFDPHDAEVYAIVRYTQDEQDPYPGEDAAQEYADDQCFDRFEDFVGVPYEESALDIATLWPTEDSWDDGDREATCAVFHVEHQKLEGTMDGAEL
ncbi:hypothetical protein B7486_55230 [cyanobacterium TDX16]|nr:hypothetical protein B7486_55230 [cyanobacterium TDX16]